VENVSFALCICEDNSAFIKNLEGAEPMTTLFPPPTAELIKSIVYSLRLNRFIALLSSSTLCIYFRQKETAILEKVHEPGELKDSEQKKVLWQGIACMELI